MQSFHIPGWTETWNYKLPNKLEKKWFWSCCWTSSQLKLLPAVFPTWSHSKFSWPKLVLNQPHPLQSRGHERIGFARDLVEEMSVQAKREGTEEGKGGLSDHDLRGTPVRRRERKRGRKERGTGKSHLRPDALLSLAWCFGQTDGKFWSPSCW